MNNIETRRLLLFAAFLAMGTIFYYFVDKMLGLGLFCGLAIQLYFLKNR